MQQSVGIRTATLFLFFWLNTEDVKQQLKLKRRILALRVFEGVHNNAAAQLQSYNFVNECKLPQIKAECWHFNLTAEETEL